MPWKMCCMFGKEVSGDLSLGGVLFFKWSRVIVQWDQGHSDMIIQASWRQGIHT